MKYNIAEVFYSLQGEGMWAGTPMLFIRLAGCNVGQYVSPDATIASPELRNLRVLNPTYSICTAITGAQFLCDTDYHGVEKVDVVDLFTWLKGIFQEHVGALHAPAHVCITGGEPFLYDLEPLERELLLHGAIKIHVETSGTKPIIRQPYHWITCSPKAGFLDNNTRFVDEWKILVNANTTRDQVEKALADTKVSIMQLGLLKGSVLVFLSPINNIHTIQDPSVENAKNLCLQSFGAWRLSMQMHKILGVR